MKKLQLAFALATISALRGLSAANSVETESTVGKDQFEENISYVGSMKSDENTKWLWNGAFDYLHTKSDVSGTDLKDNTYTFTAGGGIKAEYQGSAAMDFSSSPSEKLQSFGVHFKFGKQIEQKFTPKLRLGMEKYSQNYKAGAARLSGSRKLVNGARNGIAQTEIGAEISFDLVEWMSFGGTFSHYFYSRPVNNFLNQLDSLAALRQSASQFANQISNFADNSVSLDAEFFPTAKLELDSKLLLSRRASDHKSANALRLGAIYDIVKALSVGASYEHDFGAFSDNLVSANLTVNF